MHTMCSPVSSRSGGDVGSLVWYECSIEEIISRVFLSPSTFSVARIGRGGGINSHIGNQTFREWVRQRKEEYNLAPSKAEKAKIAHDVMNLVKQLDPPGRFLQRDPECPSNLNAWVEIDETRAIAKTSQALREGAPKIRAAHRDEIEQRAKKAKQKSASKRKAAASKTKIPTSTKLSTIPLPPLLSEPATIRPEPISTGTSVTVNSTEPSNEKTLMSEEVEPKYISPTKRFRMDGSRLHPHFTSAPSTPPLVSLPLPPVFVPPMTPSVPLSPNGRNAKGTVSPSENRLKRSHSLALSDLSVGEFSGGEEFVDPFADESILLQSNNATLKPPTPRGSRNVNGVEGDHSPNNGSRQKSSIGSWSTR